nr:hypothetical protein 4 [bacterium]
MNVEKSPDVNIRRRLPKREVPPKAESPTFLWLNKNWINYPDTLATMPAHHLLAFFTFLAVAQRQGDRKVEFTSLYHALKVLEWGDGGKQYLSLRNTLRALPATSFDFPNFYVARKHKKVGAVSKDYKRRLRQKRKRQQRSHVTLNRPVRCRRYLDGRVKIRFDQQFWRHHLPETKKRKGYRVRVDLDTMKILRTTPRMLLVLLLLTHGGDIKMKPETLARKIGLRDTNSSRLLSHLQEMADAVGHAISESVSILKYRDGQVSISWYRDDTDPTNEDRFAEPNLSHFDEDPEATIAFRRADVS